MKTIYIDRKSVCMGDDVDNHHLELKVCEDCTYSKMINEIRDISFLPSYDTMWLIQSKNQGFIAAYYCSSYSNDQPHVIWQFDFNENEKIVDGDSFYFECYLFKREVYKYPCDYDKTVELLKNKYNISDEMIQQIYKYLTSIRNR